MGGVNPGHASEGASADAPPAGVGPRLLAWEAVAEVLRSRAALDDVLDARRGPAALSARDEALARAIATAAFRHFGTLRQALAERLARGLPRNDRLFTLLVIGAAQVLLLDVPDHAAVDTTVGLARGDPRLRGFAGLVNALLRRIARERDAILAGADALRVNTPAWLAERWTRTYGDDAARAIAEAHVRGAAVDLTVKADAAGWARRLGGVLLPTGSVRLASRTAIPDLPGYREGAWWVQDAAAALPARLLAVREGERVADLCAAPGGKTAQLALAGAEVLAVDRSARRLRRLKENLARLALRAETAVADATTLEAEPFDAVLLDAPCSATGTLRRHPDAAWTKREADLAALCSLQERLLDRACALVRPGGRLVYCTCSLEPEEGEGQIAAFLQRQPGFRRLPVAPEEAPVPGAVDERGDLRTLPSFGFGAAATERSMDGFFASRLVREAA